MGNNGYTAYELIMNSIRNSPTAKEMVESQKMTIDEDKNPHKFQEFTPEYAAYILGRETKEFVGEKYKQIDDEQLEVMNKMAQNIYIVRNAIREKYPEGKEFIGDSMLCPICNNGTVYFGIHDHVNCHIHAKCSNGCVDFGE